MPTRPARLNCRSCRSGADWWTQSSIRSIERRSFLEKVAREQKQEGDIRRDLEEFRALVSDRAQHASFEDKQKLLRMVLDKVVVKDWRVDVHYNIPLSRPAAPREEKVSTNFDLCNARHESVEGVVSQLGHSVCR